MCRCQSSEKWKVVVPLNAFPISAGDEDSKEEFIKTAKDFTSMELNLDTANRIYALFARMPSEHRNRNPENHSTEPDNLYRRFLEVGKAIVRQAADNHEKKLPDTSRTDFQSLLQRLERFVDDASQNVGRKHGCHKEPTSPLEPQTHDPLSVLHYSRSCDDLPDSSSGDSQVRGF
jgi:hypothetical protein